MMRPPQMSDYGAWAELRALSREHLMPWEPLWPRDELTRSSFRRRLRHYARELREDQGYALFILDDNERLLGGLTLSNVRRGVTQAASLGYWLGAPYIRRGYMTEAVRAMIPFAQGPLRLHRVEAACLPNNRASIAVLEKNGFAREGYARLYLKIAGQWQDHVLFGLVAEDLGLRGGAAAQ
jgi:ribosomal-protein-alanine N-acetyltransferase